MHGVVFAARQTSVSILALPCSPLCDLRQATYPTSELQLPHPQG